MIPKIFVDGCSASDAATSLNKCLQCMAFFCSSLFFEIIMAIPNYKIVLHDNSVVS